MRDTIELAREAGFELGKAFVNGVLVDATTTELKAFEALVRADEQNKQCEAFQQILSSVKAIAIADEREACAKFCETNQVWVGKVKRGFIEWGEDEFVTGGIHQGMDYAAAIRARGNT
jgi:hypothetical protein